MLYMATMGSDLDKLGWPANWGIIATPSRRKHLGTRPWCGDNEVFTGKFEWLRFYYWLKKMRIHQSHCLFIVAPDVVADPIATRARFDLYAPAIRSLGFPVAFAAQDGQESLPFPEFDAIFIGGSTEWKLSDAADYCIRYAQQQGRWVHVGRVNSKLRIRHFQTIGVDSVDGTAIAYRPDRNRKLLQSQLDQTAFRLFT